MDINERIYLLAIQDSQKDFGPTLEAQLQLFKDLLESLIPDVLKTYNASIVVKVEDDEPFITLKSIAGEAYGETTTVMEGSHVAYAVVFHEYVERPAGFERNELLGIKLSHNKPWQLTNGTVCPIDPGCGVYDKRTPALVLTAVMAMQMKNRTDRYNAIAQN